MFIIALLTTLLVIGIKESANFNNIMVIVKVSVIILFIVIGFFFVKSANWKPFIPPNTGEFGHFGWSGIFRAAGVIFFCLYRVRCGIDGGTESKKSPEGYANWHTRLSWNFHDPLYPGCDRADRNCQLHFPECCRSDGSGCQCSWRRYVLAAADHQK